MQVRGTEDGRVLHRLHIGVHLVRSHCHPVVQIAGLLAAASGGEEEYITVGGYKKDRLASQGDLQPILAYHRGVDLLLPQTAGEFCEEWIFHFLPLSQLSGALFHFTASKRALVSYDMQLDPLIFGAQHINPKTKNGRRPFWRRP